MDSINSFTHSFTLNLDQTEYIMAPFTPIQLNEGSTQAFYVATTEIRGVWTHRDTGSTIEDENIKISVRKRSPE